MLDGTLVERTADVIYRAEVVSSVYVRRTCFRGNHDDGDIFYPALFVHHGKHFEPVHLRHDYIEQHERNFQLVLL